MSNNTLEKRIDFVMVLEVKGANPNGNVEDGGPRTDINGYGEMTAECFKHKTRMALQDAGESILYQSETHDGADGYHSIEERVTATLGDKALSKQEQIDTIREKYLDVRLFGATIAFKGKKKDKTSEGVSIGISGPLTILPIKSVDPVTIRRLGITKSVNGEDVGPDKKASDTMGGERNFVEYGLYLVKGSINPYQAAKTNLTEADVEKLKSALRNLFVNDTSVARPAGSMTPKKIFWWEHSSKAGQYNVSDVYDSVKVVKKPGVGAPTRFEDYTIEIDDSYQTGDRGVLKHTVL